jgi:hypothetical protein
MAKGGRDVRLARARNPGGYTEMLQALGFESLRGSAGASTHSGGR